MRRPSRTPSSTYAHWIFPLLLCLGLNGCLNEPPSEPSAPRSIDLDLSSVDAAAAGRPRGNGEGYMGMLSITRGFLLAPSRVCAGTGLRPGYDRELRILGDHSGELIDPCAPGLKTVVSPSQIDKLGEVIAGHQGRIFEIMRNPPVAAQITRSWKVWCRAAMDSNGFLIEREASGRLAVFLYDQVGSSIEMEPPFRVLSPSPHFPVERFVSVSPGFQAWFAYPRDPITKVLSGEMEMGGVTQQIRCLDAEALLPTGPHYFGGSP